MDSFGMDETQVNLDVALEVVSDAVGVTSQSVTDVVDAVADTPEGETPELKGDQRNTLKALIAASAPVFSPDPLHDEDTQVKRPKNPALEAARKDAQSSGISIKAAETHLDIAASVRILDQVFAPGLDGHYYPPSLLRNILAAGSSVLIAWEGDQPIGTILSLPAWGDAGPMIQSGPMAVLPQGRGKKVSLALKYAQLAWGIERGLKEIRWSFDLLDKRLARLNLFSLSTDVVAFLPGFDGVRDTSDDNSIPNDRLLVRWNLDNLDEETTLPGDLERCWGVREVDGELQERNWQGRPLVYLELPADIKELRVGDPVKAARWQRLVGTALEKGLQEGYQISVSSKGAYRMLK